MFSSPPHLESLAADYRNTAEHNDGLYQAFTASTLADPLLAAHRRHIEDNQLGFGDPAFHSMWQMLIEAAVRRFNVPKVLEVGVYKGQVISLWALLARTRGWDVRISALSPMAGQAKPRSFWMNWILYRTNRRFRERVDNGDFYEDADYERIVRALFRHWNLDFDRVTLLRGYSTDPEILRSLQNERFHVIYVDGDHTFAGARHDFLKFGEKVVPGGWLVADDAAVDVPGTAFWKGHEAVTRAVSVLPSLGFRNVLNVGHNRIFERAGA